MNGPAPRQYRIESARCGDVTYLVNVIGAVVPDTDVLEAVAARLTEVVQQRRQYRPLSATGGGTLRGDVFYAVRRAGKHGATVGEIVSALSLPRRQIADQVGKLRRAGSVRPTGLQRKAGDGQPEPVYAVVNYEDASGAANAPAHREVLTGAFRVPVATMRETVPATPSSRRHHRA